MNNFIKTYLLLFLIASSTSFGYEFSAMTLNVDNLFDTLDDVKKDDKAYLPIEFKQSEAHKKSCNRIPVNSWKNECLYLDWNEGNKKCQVKKYCK